MVHFYFASVQPITSFIIHVIHYLASSHNPRSQNKRSICIGCHLNNSNFYLNPTELYWKTSISVATLIKTKGTSGSSSSCCLWMIWVYKLTVTFAIFIQHAVIYFSKNSAKKKKKSIERFFIYILQILSNLPKYAVSLIYSPFICTATTDPLYLHKSPFLLSRPRALELHFSGSLWLCVVVSLKSLSSRSPSC